MSMNKLKCLIAAVLLLSMSCSEKEEVVIIETPYGNMTAVLFDDTPLHKENFLTLAKGGQYDSVLFHRVINQFMIQTGDVSTGANPIEIDYTLPAEFVPETHIHRKGALAAARRGDSGNPTKASSGSQFYIVHGEAFDEEGLQKRAERRQYLKLYGFFDRMLKSKRYPELTEKYYYHVNKLEEDSTYDFNTAQRELIFNSLPVIEQRYGPQPDPGYEDWAKEVYATEGGAPHLDGQYTVFGQVVEGLEVIDKIAAVETNASDRPLEDVRMTVKIVKMSRAQIESQYNFVVPQLEE
jgi:peptidyl-prolyl cis-trans isomerase B (cyclophilin B)